MTQLDSLHTGEAAPPGEAATVASFRRGGTMHDLFASCVRRYPSASALVHHETRLTYSELDALSDHYAVALEQAGIGPGDLVPVIMERSPELVGVLLGVLKRGAAYSAMDPRWPHARLAALVAQLHARLVVTSTGGPWPVRAWAPPVHDPAAPARRPSPVRVSPDDPCVVLFTSGSTGAPKGVVYPHRGTVRLFDECDWMPLGPGVTIPQVSAVSWDGCMIDCWGPLLTGGTTVLVDEPILIPAALSELHDRHGVNVVWLTPSIFNMLVDEGVQSFAGIHTVLIGGEKASSVHARRFLENHPGTRLINIYGPSECGVLSSFHDISLSDCDAADGIPIGKAVRYTGIHVLDGSRVCEDGQVGEICLAGVGLAIGYLDNAELTARQFADVDIDGTPRRMYRTGDLGHWSADRTLCFDGRIDLQVQVYGFRIEPAEIELAATRIAGVTMSAVVPLRRNGAIDGLALFYVSRQVQVSEGDVRAELSGQLPAYLMPRRITRLDGFPLLGNGKLDRLGLEDTASAAKPAPASPGDPRGATEIAVADVFSEVLGTPTVPRTVSLFSLGGDSLSAAQVCVRLELATGVKVQMSQLFRTPSIAELAAWLEASGVDAAQRSAAVTERSAGGLVALTPMQGAWTTSPIVSDIVWWLDGSVDEDVLERAATDIHRRHQALYARYVMSGPDLGYATLPADPGKAQFHRLPAARDDAAAVEAVRAVLLQPFRLDDGEVWRCALVRSPASGRSLFGVAVHHLAFDGLSATIFVPELSAAYAARIRGMAPEFGAPVGSLADFETDYRQLLAVADLDAQRQYWLGEFRGLQPCYLPDHTSEPRSFFGPIEAPVFAVEPTEWQPWEAYGRSNGMTAFVCFAAVYAQALIDAGAPRDLGLSFIFTRRGSKLLDRSIGNRIGHSCLRPNGPSRDGQHLLARMRDAHSKAMAALDLCLDNKERSAARAVSGMRADGDIIDGTAYLVYQDAPIPALKLGDLTGTVSPEFGGLTLSPFDFNLDVRPGSAGDFSLCLAVRTDIYPAGLADKIAGFFLEIIRDGPARLEQRTAS